MPPLRQACAALAAALILTTLHAQAPPKDTAPAPLPTLATKTAGMKHLPGFLPLDWDARAGKLYLEIPADRLKPDAELLYTNSLPYGTGSNDLGLDRGQTAEGKVVVFERIGPRVLLVEHNQAFRSSATDPAERLAVTQSFPSSVLWGFTVAAEDTASADGSGAVLLDATDFFLRDAHGVLESLAANQQGAYKLDISRSAIDLDGTRAFPANTEVEAILTFTTDAAPHGRFVRDVTPDPHALTLHERHSLLALPPLDGTFTPRRFNPRSGFFPTTYRDYSAPLGADLDQLFIPRHRLLKRDPTCTKSCQAIKPIQYYVDNGAPEPIRSALLEGARWWDQAFQAAGWAPNTFRVDILPAGMDPMDARINIIQWVHRYTRGWSYGAAVTDPRTGEILKGNVTLGSLRGRQDYLIAEALTAPYSSTSPAPAPDPILQMVLARLRQLAAHETGHTLGLAHNFAASTVSQSESVMDYPHPYITLDKNGVPDLSHAYAVNIGAWDKVSIDYGYREIDQNGKPFEDNAALAAILRTADKAGHVFLTDQDARPLGSASPLAHLWDNGPDPVAELTRVLDVRRAALARFGENAIRPGTPLSQLELTLTPLYLFHRYQTEAATKLLGGLDYRDNLRGDGQPLPTIVPAAQQRAALTAILRTLSPATLTLPEPILRQLPPTAFGYPRTQESLPAHTGLTFDPIAAAESAADLTLATLFGPARANRLVQYHARDAAQLSLEDVIHQTNIACTVAPTETGLPQLVAQAVQHRFIEALLTLATSPGTGSAARAIVLDRLIAIEPSLSADLVLRIESFEKDPAKFTPAKSIDAPPGMPIGDDEDF